MNEKSSAIDKLVGTLSAVAIIVLYTTLSLAMPVAAIVFIFRSCNG